MGLDVHLQHYDDVYRRYRLASAAVWQRVLSENRVTETGISREELTVRITAARKTHSEELAPLMSKLGLDTEDKSTIHAVTINLPSAKYPEHRFRIGNWRSSYNSGGFDYVLHMLTGQTLYDIFPEVKDYHSKDFLPDWNAAQVRAVDLLESLRHIVEIAPYGVLEFPPETSPRPIDAINTKHDALQAFVRERTRHMLKEAPKMNHYSNASGTFVFDQEPFRVVGLIHGQSSDEDETRGRAPNPNKERVPATYLIYEIEGKYEWYVQALEIVVETIEWVLRQPDPDHYFLNWSS